jgi:hypothetical protein
MDHFSLQFFEFSALTSDPCYRYNVIVTPNQRNPLLRDVVWTKILFLVEVVYRDT